MPDAGFLGGQSSVEVAKAPEAPVIEVQEGEDEVAQAERQALQAAQATEQREHFLEAGQEDAPTTQVVAAPVAEDPTTVMATAATPTKDEVMLSVEDILQDGLGDYFKEMPPEVKERFRAKGMEVSTEVSEMVRKMQIQAEKVLRLIKEWLLTIPGVNKFFLEQEAKIKTDRILGLAAERRNDIH